MSGRKHAVVVLPPANVGGAAQIPLQHRRWLGRSRIIRSAPDELLLQVLSVLSVAAPATSFGALRLWGQTATRPEGWVAAADPVFLEPMLDHLVLHALHEEELGEGEVAEIFDYLQNSLAADGEHAFMSVGNVGYLRGARPMPTARASPAAAQGGSPESFFPRGNGATAHDRLQSEVQMCLHQSEVNERRAMSGKRPVNGLWMWGGGAAPLPSKKSLPPLYADDPLFRGYWSSVSAAIAGWPRDLEECLEASPAGFVAVLPEASGTASEMSTHLGVLRRMLQRGRLRAVTLIPGRGLRVEINRWDRLRLWRRGEFKRLEEKDPG